MKILITSDSYLPRLGGAEIYALKLGSLLKRDGYDITLFTTEENTGIEESPFKVLRYSYRHNPRSIFIFLKKLYREYKQADIITCIYSYKIATIVCIFKIFVKKPVVVVLQGLGTLDAPGSNWFHSKIHSFYRFFSIKNADMNIAACLEFIDISLKYTNKEKIVYIPNAVDSEQFRIHKKNLNLIPQEDHGKRIVTTIRRLVPKNGIQFLIESIPYIIPKYNNVVFMIIGWGPLEQYLKDRVRVLGIQDYVRFLGRIENDVLPQYLNLADVVVFPSTAEATSIACLESMALGKPIIASKVGGYLEMVQDGYNGRLVDLTGTVHSDYDAPMLLDEKKLQSLASSLVEIIADEEKMLQYGGHSRLLIEEKFSWDLKIKDVQDVYDRVRKN